MTYEDIEQSDGSIKRNYSIVAGDTYSGTVTITKGGENIDPSLVTSLKFKLSDRDYNCLYSTPFTYNSDIQKYVVEIPSDKTKEIGVGRYIYECELTLASGYVTTLMQANFKITNEIEGCPNG